MESAVLAVVRIPWLVVNPKLLGSRVLLRQMSKDLGSVSRLAAPVRQFCLYLSLDRAGRRNRYLVPDVQDKGFR